MKPNETIQFGIFGTGKITADENGFIELPVIVQESGLYVGAPPAELRISEVGIWGEDDFNKQYVAKKNTHTDLPFYLATAKVKIVGPMTEWTEEKLKEIGLKPLVDKKENE